MPLLRYGISCGTIEKEVVSVRDDIRKLKSVPLFAGVREEDMDGMLTCLGGYTRTYRKGEFLFRANEPVQSVGVLLDGALHVIQEDVWGNKRILTRIGEGELFGETFACGSRAAAVSCTAAEDCRVLFLPFRRVLHSCDRFCAFHHRLIENMVVLIADKNMLLMEKIEVISKKTLREKILTYLFLQAQRQGRDYFEIPLGRVALAEYLCADRSALTRELAGMKAEGLIDYEKNTFRLLEK